MPDFRIEWEIIKKGFKTIAGVDEAGRGALFGPVVAAAVILPEAMMRQYSSGWVKEIDDSKVVSPQKRKRLLKSILTNADSVGIGVVTNFEIDQKNIYWASLNAMKKAVMNLPKAADFLLVDGFRIKDLNHAQMSISQGDKKSISIAAASIVAKVLRDEILIRLDKIYEGYALSRHKGYGTEEHYRALEDKGPTFLHRLTFNLNSRRSKV